MNIQPLVFVETDAFQATFTAKYRSLLSADLNGMDTLTLRTEAEDMPVLKEWKSARTLLSKIRNGAAAFLDGVVPELGYVELRRLKPHTATPWTIEGREDIHRIHLCIVPSPAAYVYCGGQMAILPVGMINLVNHRALCSEANFGDFPRTHLVVDLKVPTDAED
jgi:hypothetical protein